MPQAKDLLWKWCLVCEDHVFISSTNNGAMWLCTNYDLWIKAEADTCPLFVDAEVHDDNMLAVKDG